MKLQNRTKFSLFAAALLAAFAFPAGMCAQAAPTIKAAVPVKRPARPHPRKFMSEAGTVSAVAQNAVQSEPSAQTSQEGAPAVPVAAANSPVQPVVPATPSASSPAASDPARQVQNGVNQVNDKKQKAKSIWRQLKTIKK